MRTKKSNANRKSYKKSKNCLQSVFCGADTTNGLSLKENSSGKHKGETTISRRGRARLRGILFNAVISLLASNEGFQAIHSHYTNRTENPLKRKQSVIAICCKLIRIFYVILKRWVAYDERKLLLDIKWYDSVVA